MGFLSKFKKTGKKVAKKMANTIGGPTNKNTGKRTIGGPTNKSGTGKRTVSIMGKKTGLGGLLRGRKPIKPQGGGKTTGGGLGLGRPKGPMKPKSRGMFTPTARGIKPMQGVKMYAGGGDVIAGSTQNRRAMQGAVVAKSGVKKMMGGGMAKSGVKKLGRGGKLKK